MKLTRYSIGKIFDVDRVMRTIAGATTRMPKSAVGRDTKCIRISPILGYISWNFTTKYPVGGQRSVWSCFHANWPISCKHVRAASLIAVIFTVNNISHLVRSNILHVYMQLWMWGGLYSLYCTVKDVDHIQWKLYVINAIENLWFTAKHNAWRILLTISITLDG